ncbi:MAG: Fe-S cluster assembly protein SufD, partial [Acidimicrobiales bacterium]
RHCLDRHCLDRHCLDRHCLDRHCPMTAMVRPATMRRPLSGIGVGMGVQVPERASEPGWLKAARRRAAAWVDANGFPSTKHEDWRYTKLDAALAVPLVAPSGGAAEDGPGSVSSSDLPVPHLGGSRVVVVNGRVVPDLSAIGAAVPGGIRVESLAGALQGLDGRLEQSWARRVGGYPHALRALNDAAALDAVVIDLPAGTVVEDPIEVFLISMGAGAARWSHPRLIVMAGAEARATLVETYLGVAGTPTVTNALTQVELGAGAEIVHYVMQGESTDSFHFSSLEGRLADHSRLCSRLLATGGRIGRHEVDIVLAGQGSQVDLDGLFLTGSGQHHDNPLLVDHAVPGCTSRQLYKGVVAGDGHGVFNGHIVVRPGADGTDAAQVNKNLLLSERAEVDTRPRLEINADDVACSHGAAVGQLDPDAIFYLCSRGVPEREARTILVSGFAREVLDRFVPGPIRQRAEQLAMSAGVVVLDDHRHDPGENRTVTAEAANVLPRGPRT